MEWFLQLMMYIKDDYADKGENTKKVYYVTEPHGYEKAVKKVSSVKAISYLNAALNKYIFFLRKGEL